MHIMQPKQSCWQRPSTASWSFTMLCMVWARQGECSVLLVVQLWRRWPHGTMATGIEPCLRAAKQDPPPLHSHSHFHLMQLLMCSNGEPLVPCHLGLGPHRSAFVSHLPWCRCAFLALRVVPPGWGAGTTAGWPGQTATGPLGALVLPPPQTLPGSSTEMGDKAKMGCHAA